jgi:hypothetical protein
VAYSLKIEGLGKTELAFKNYPRRLRAEVDAEFADAANDFALRAKRAAPGDTGFLQNGIRAYKEKELSHSVSSNQIYSAFVEWGTRSRVRIPAGLENYAAQFKGKSDGLGAKQAIFAWCERKGIDPKLWYPIFISIMVRGISPTPFFFKQMDIVKPQLMANLKRIPSKL